MSVVHVEGVMSETAVYGTPKEERKAEVPVEQWEQYTALRYKLKEIAHHALVASDYCAALCNEEDTLVFVAKYRDFVAHVRSDLIDAMSEFTRAYLEVSFKERR